MVRIALLVAWLIPVAAIAGAPPVVDSRLAAVVEGAVKDTGFNINVSSAARYSLNINTINGHNVCDAAAASDARRLQDALNDQPNIKDNFGPAYFSVTEADGTRKVLSPQDLKDRGLLKACTNIYVSVAER